MSDAAIESLLVTMHMKLDSRLELLDRQMEKVQTQVDQVARRQEFLPSQIRGLSGKMDELTTSINDSRIVELLKDFMQFYDLLDQMGKFLKPSECDRAHNKDIQTLRRQVLHVLKVNGIEPIQSEESGTFDPALHKIVKVIDCDDSGKDGLICDVYREGFRTASSVMRYMEVSVTSYREPADVERLSEEEEKRFLKDDEGENDFPGGESAEEMPVDNVTDLEINIKDEEEVSDSPEDRADGKNNSIKQ